jgi:transposase-like protein
LADYKKPEDLIGEHGLLKQLTKALVERALHAEMAEHLGHGKNEPVENVTGNTRNGTSQKTLQSDFGKLPIDIPRDRHGTSPGYHSSLITHHSSLITHYSSLITHHW